MYDSLVSASHLTSDDHQRRVVAKLSRVSDILAHYKPPRIPDEVSKDRHWEKHNKGTWFHVYLFSPFLFFSLSCFRVGGEPWSNTFTLHVLCMYRSLWQYNPLLLYLSTDYICHSFLFKCTCINRQHLLSRVNYTFLFIHLYILVARH